MSSVKRIICLANSKKLSERCIAGIDIATGRWIRPVCDSLYPNDGRVPRSICLIDGIEPELLDILEISLAETGNNFDFESENLSILKGQWKVIGKSNVQDIINYCDNGLILHNSFKLVYPSFLKTLPLDKRKTLQLINVVSLSINSRNTSKGGTQWLGTIVSSYGERLVDIPITDSVFIAKIESGYQPNGQYIITMSLGMPYKPNNWEGDEAPCWKLIAGVMEISGTQLASHKSELESEIQLITEINKLQLSLCKVGTLNASSPMISISENQNLMALSSDGDLVIVKCWDTQEYLKYIRKVEVRNSPIYSKILEVDYNVQVFFSADGQLLGTLNLHKGEVQCWSIASNQLLYKFTDISLINIREVYEGDEDEGVSDFVLISTHMISFSSEKNIIVCSYFGIKVWKEGKLLYSIPQYCVTGNYMITRDMEEVIAFNNIRDVFVFTDNKSQITSLINLKSGQLMTTLRNNSSDICRVILSHDASLLVLVCKNGILKLYDLSSNKFLKSLSALDGYEIFDVKVSSDLNHIAVISAKGGNEWEHILFNAFARLNDDRNRRKKEVELIRGEYGVKILNIQTEEVVAFIDYSDKCHVTQPHLVTEHISQLLFSNDGKLLFIERRDDWFAPCWVEVFHLFYQ